MKSFKSIFTIVLIINLLSCGGSKSSNEPVNTEVSKIDTTYLNNGDMIITKYSDSDRSATLSETFNRGGFNYSINIFINDSTVARKSYFCSTKELNIEDTIIINPKTGTGTPLHNIGLSKLYSEDGKLKNTTQYDSFGQQHGLYESYFNNGIVKTKVHSKHGIRTESFNYYENGNIQMEGYFNSEDHKSGTWNYYLESGQLGAEIIYENGQEIKRNVISTDIIPLLPSAP